MAGDMRGNTRMIKNMGMVNSSGLIVGYYIKLFVRFTRGIGRMGNNMERVFILVHHELRRRVNG